MLFRDYVHLVCILEGIPLDDQEAVVALTDRMGLDYDTVTAIRYARTTNNVQSCFPWLMRHSNELLNQLRNGARFSDLCPYVHPLHSSNPPR